MNPITNTKNQNRMNEKELLLGYTGSVSSWHNQYKDSAWIYIGGLNYELTEGDVICVFSQYGEIVNINLPRDGKSGNSKGFAFVCYEDQRSTILAVDNLNGITLCGRIIRVDHVEKYRVPKDGTMNVKSGISKTTELDKVASFVREQGCGPEVMRKVEKLQKEIERKKDTHKEINKYDSELSRRPSSNSPEQPSSYENKYDKEKLMMKLERKSPPRNLLKLEKLRSSRSPPRRHR